MSQLSKADFDFLSLYFIFSVLITYSLGKQGSDTNYLLEWCVTSFLLLGVGLSRVRSPGRQCLVYGVLIGQLLAWVGPVEGLRQVKQRMHEREEFYDRISSLIKKIPGKVLSEDMGLLTASGREIFYEPFPMGQMSYSGVWDQKPILDELDKKGFSLVVLYTYVPLLIKNRTFTPEFIAMFKKRYRYLGRIPLPVGKDQPPQSLFLYVPN